MWCKFLTLICFIVVYAVESNPMHLELKDEMTENSVGSYEENVENSNLSDNIESTSFSNSFDSEEIVGKLQQHAQDDSSASNDSTVSTNIQVEKYIKGSYEGDIADPNPIIYPNEKANIEISFPPTINYDDVKTTTRASFLDMLISLRKSERTTQTSLDV